MSRADKEAVIICLDVGKNSAELSGKGDKTFLQRAIECAKKIVVRKIFAKPTDEIGFILFGSDNTNNDLNNKDFGYENIEELDSLKMPSWDMLEKLDKMKPGNAVVGWSDTLIVALQYLSNETEAKKFNHMRVILFTNFLTSTDESNLNVIIENVANTDVELIGVSDSVYHENTENVSTWHFTENPGKQKDQRESEKTFEEMTKSIETANLCHIDYVESQLMYFQKKTTRGSPWNVPLTIGSKLSINVSAFVFIQANKTTSFKTECAEFHTVTKMVTDYTKNNESIEKPCETETVKAYMYGTKINACEDSNISYDSGDKCLSCIAFSKKKKCSPNLFAGSGCHVIVSQKGCPKSAALFNSLVRNMVKKDFFMVARKVYRKGTKASIVGLFPQVSEEGSYFVMIELPHKEDIQRCRYEKFKNKESAKPSEEQMECMRKLVESMDLRTAIDDDSGNTEAFTLENCLNPFTQHICKTVAHRALNPTAPLPKFDEDLRKMIDVPEKIKNNSAEIIKEIERLFPVEYVHHKEKKLFGQQARNNNDDDIELSVQEMADSIQNADLIERHVVSVGTVTPAEDFLHLVHKRTEKFSILCEQIQSVIHEFLFKSTIELGDKILESILAYRDSAKIHAPFNYNTWITDLKKLIIKRNKINEWEKYIVKEGLGLITMNESPLSTVSIEENIEFYEIASKETNVSSAINPEDDELENLL